MIHRLVFLLMALFSSIFVSSQNIEGAKNFIYYERWISAEKTLKEIIAKEDVSPDAYYWLGEVYMNNKDYKDAKNIFQNGIKMAAEKGYSFAKSPLIYIGMAHWKLSQGLKEEALGEMKNILDASKDKNAAALLAAAKANIENENGNIKQAIDWLKIAIKKEKDNPEIYAAMGDAYRKFSDGSNAYKFYREALNIRPTFAEAHHKMGEIFKTQKSPDEFIKEFTEALKADPKYSPSMYELYYYYFYKGDFRLAKEYLDHYILNSDPSIQNEYRKADLFYVTKNYPEAINTAKAVITKEGDNAKPRIYKMLAYCYNELGDSVSALQSISDYFKFAKEGDYVTKDFELRANLLEKNEFQGKAVAWYEKALTRADKEGQKEKYMRKIAKLLKATKDYENESKWRERIYTEVKSSNNVDLFNWGLSLYFSGNYKRADSVFGLYAEKYPKQLYGYLWRARCNVAIDTSMELGLAVPHYEKFIEVAKADSIANRKTLIAAYSYLGAYEANIHKDYVKALDYFERVLGIDQTNENALRVSEVLKKWMDKKKDKNNTSS